MSKARDQSNILNGGQTVENAIATEIGLAVRGHSNQSAPVLEVEDGDLTMIRTVGGTGSGTRTEFHAIEIIDNDLELYVSLTGNDTSGNGSASNPWKTPHKAMEWLHYRRIVGTQTQVTIHIAAGNYTFDKPIVSNHPDGGKIRIIGAGLNGNKPLGVPIGDYMSNSGLPGVWGGDGTNKFGVNPVVPARTADQFYNSAGTLGSNHPVTTRNAKIEEDLNNNLSLIISRYKTRLNFTGDCAGFMAHGGAIGLIDKLAVIGDWFSNHTIGDWDYNKWSTSKHSCGIYACGHEQWKDDSGSRDPEKVLAANSGGNITVGDQVVVQNFAIGVYSTDNSTIQVIDGHGYSTVPGEPDFTWAERMKPTGISVVNCKWGLYAWNESTLMASGSTIQGCEVYGVASGTNSTIYIHRSVVSGCAAIGVTTLRQSYIKGIHLVTSGNGSTGISITDNSGFNGDQTHSCGNAGNGIVASGGSVIEDGAPEVCGNTGYGVHADRNSMVQISVTTEHYAEVTQTNTIYSATSNQEFIGLGMIYNNAGVGIGCYHGSTMFADNIWWTGWNGLHGIGASRGSNLSYTAQGGESDADIDAGNRILPRPYCGSNDVKGGYREVVCYHGSALAIYGASIVGQSWTQHVVSSSWVSDIYLSAYTYSGRKYHKTNISGGSTSHARVDAHANGAVYDYGSNLTASPSAPTYYDPARPNSTDGYAMDLGNGGIIYIHETNATRAASQSDENDELGPEDDKEALPPPMDDLYLPF